jgi:hypothetical protein
MTGASAIIAGFVARAQAKQRPAAVGGATMAAWGIALGLVNLMLSVLAVVYWLNSE